ncbi:MAG: aminotransferase class I/II-fold pyridoxal phosphate-dependent enzyme [Rheinheimera sp.]|nr:aminotransferase class I/II-fold pyridoxal phosphate-dependent enzyme [Rheinheimera sp.]
MIILGLLVKQRLTRLAQSAGFISMWNWQYRFRPQLLVIIIHTNVFAKELCDWLGVDAVLLFSSGFAANQALISGLVAKTDLLLMDKLAHASMIDAATQLPKGFKRFLHNDLSALERAFCQNPGPHVVATEGVFSMDGDSPSMAELVALCQQNQAPLLLDTWPWCCGA